MPDDPTIPDDAIVWRYVSSQWVVAGEDGAGVRPSTGAFDDSSDGDPMSAVLASEGRDPATIIPRGSSGGGVVQFTAGFLRERGLALERAPEPNEADHILVSGKKTGGVKKALKKNAFWVVQGKRGGE